MNKETAYPELENALRQLVKRFGVTFPMKRDLSIYALNDEVTTWSEYGTLLKVIEFHPKLKYALLTDNHGHYTSDHEVTIIWLVSTLANLSCDYLKILMRKKCSWNEESFLGLYSSFEYSITNNRRKLKNYSTDRQYRGQ